MAGLDRYGKSRPHQDSMPGPSSPYTVAIPSELPGQFFLELAVLKLESCGGGGMSSGVQ
jgi:hypothetical protein